MKLNATIKKNKLTIDKEHKNARYAIYKLTGRKDINSDDIDALLQLNVHLQVADSTK